MLCLIQKVLQFDKSFRLSEVRLKVFDRDKKSGLNVPRDVMWQLINRGFNQGALDLLQMPNVCIR